MGLCLVDWLALLPERMSRRPSEAFDRWRELEEKARRLCLVTAAGARKRRGVNDMLADVRV